jgi:hypothetical protein
MKYLCLAYGDEAKWAAQSEAERAAVAEQCAAFDDLLRGSGHLIDMQPLEPSSGAALLRRQGGKLAVTDGPYVETREQLGGYYLIEARDFNEALQVLSSKAAALQPMGERLGWCVEVRPIGGPLV